ncbi:hypothetical protein ABT132_51370, partial [Streptomyces mirabilis]
MNWSRFQWAAFEYVINVGFAARGLPGRREQGECRLMRRSVRQMPLASFADVGQRRKHSSRRLWPAGSKHTRRPVRSLPPIMGVKRKLSSSYLSATSTRCDQLLETDTSKASPACERHIRAHATLHSALDLKDVYWAKQGRISVDVSLGILSALGLYLTAVP